MMNRMKEKGHKDIAETLTQEARKQNNICREKGTKTFGSTEKARTEEWKMKTRKIHRG